MLIKLKCNNLCGILYALSLFFFSGFSFAQTGVTLNSSKIKLAQSIPQDSWKIVGNPGFSGGSASYVNLALDNLEVPYIAFQDASESGKASVMKYTESGWKYVGKPGFSSDVALFTNLAFDSYGTPYIAFGDGKKEGATGPATVMKYDGSSWVNVGSPKFAENAYGIRLAISKNGTPYVVFAPSAKARVMKYNGSNWELVGSESAFNGVAPNLCLAINNSGIPYVAYSNWSNQAKLTVKKYIESSGWVDVGNANNPETPTYVSLAFDNGETPYVGYVDYTVGVLKYTESGWVNVGESHVSVSDATNLDMKIDRSGTPYVAYSDWKDGSSSPSGGKVSVKKYTAQSGWEYVGESQFSTGKSEFVNIVIDKNGTPYVGYRDAANSYKTSVMKFK